MRSFDIPEIYKSSLIAEIKEKRKQEDPMKKDFSPSVLNHGNKLFVIPRHFGFCFGVENAIERAYKAVKENPGKRIFLLSQMIHNPVVNKDLEENGIGFLQDTLGNSLYPLDDLTSDDVVLIPAFGTTVELEDKLREKGIDIKTYNTTCPFVEKVWKRSAKLSADEHTIIIHGKPKHEETRATFSQTSKNGAAIVVKNIEESRVLGEMILNNDFKEFDKVFGDRVSHAFNPEADFDKVGVVNQTTMLASETQEIAEYFRQVAIEKFGEANIKDHFADTRDTLCYATNDNQNATLDLLNQDADLAIVVGGYNSSNTSHIVELLEDKFKTIFVKGEEEIGEKKVSHFNIHSKEIVSSEINWSDLNKIIITSGASCPDALLEAVIKKVANY